MIKGVVKCIVIVCFVRNTIAQNQAPGSPQPPIFLPDEPFWRFVFEPPSSRPPARRHCRPSGAREEAQCLWTTARSGGPDARAEFYRALHIFETIGDDRNVALIRIELASFLYRQSDFLATTATLFPARNYFASAGDIHALARCVSLGRLAAIGQLREHNGTSALKFMYLASSRLLATEIGSYGSANPLPPDLAPWVTLFDAYQISQGPTAGCLWEAEGSWRKVAESVEAAPLVRGLAWLALASAAGDPRSSNFSHLGLALGFLNGARLAFESAGLPQGSAQADLIKATHLYKSGDLAGARYCAMIARKAFERRGIWTGAIQAELIRAKGEMDAGQAQPAQDAAAEVERLATLHLLRSDVGKVAWDLSGTRLEDLIHKINEAPEIKGQSKAGGPVSSNKIRAFYDWARQTGHPYLELVALRVLAQSLAAEGQWKSGIVYTIQAQDLRQRLVARIPLRQRLMEAGRLDYRLLLKAGLKNEPVVSTDYSSMAAQIVSFSEAILPPFAARAHLEQSDLKRVKDLLSNVTELSATVDRRRLDALDLLARGRRVESARQLDLFFQDLAKLLEGLRQLAPITATKTADAGGRESRSIYSGNILAYVNGLDKAVILSHEETLAAAVDTLAGTIEKAGGETSAEGFLPITLGGIGIGAQIRATRTALSDSGKDWVRRVASTVSAISDAIDRPISLRGTRMGHVIATLAASGVQEGLTVRLLGGTPEELAGHDSALFRGIYATQIALSLGKGGGFLELPGWRTASDMVASFKRMPQAAKWAKTLACLHAMNWLQSLRSLAVKEMRTRPELRRSIEIFTWYAMESWEEGGDDWDDDEKVNNESILKEFGFGTWASKYPALLLMLAGDRKQADSLATLMQSAQGDLDRASESTRLPSPLVDEGPDLFTARREIAFNLAIYFMAVSQYTDATQQLRRLVDSGQGGDGIDVYQYHYALALCYRRLNNPDAELLSLAAAVSGAQRLRQSMPIGNLAFRATDVRRLLTEEYLGLLYRRGQAREMEAVIWRYRRPARAPAALFRSQRDKEVPDLAALKDLYGALSTDAESPVTAADIRSVLARLAMGLVETANPGSLHFGGRPGEADASDTGLKPGDPSLNGIELAASALIDEISFSRPASDRLSITGPPRGRPVVEKDELLISYFVGMQGVFFVTTDGKGITRPYYRRVDYSQLEELCDKFRKGLAAERSTEETAGKIYELMLGRVPELNDTRKLRIIADGPLQLIPFQALRPSRTAPYLIERFNVEYVSGAPEPPISTNERRQARSVLVVANPGGDLKYSEGEARAIEDASGAPGPPALIGPKATIENVRRSLTEVGTVHFATHAQRNANQPNFSFLTLAGHDRIYSIDFEVLDLRGKRVFLAGCETLLAEAAFGDDVYGLADAVMGAGSSSVVATLWDVEDEASAKFASVFYKTLRDGGTDTEALAATERYFISGQAGPRLASPKFWAGFNHLTPLPFMAAP